MKLIHAKKNSNYIITGFSDDELDNATKNRLIGLGFHIGSEIKINNHGILNDPIAVSVNDSVIAIRHSMAQKILVKENI